MSNNKLIINTTGREINFPAGDAFRMWLPSGYSRYSREKVEPSAPGGSERRKLRSTRRSRTGA